MYQANLKTCSNLLSLFKFSDEIMKSGMGKRPFDMKVISKVSH